jgi:amino acid adenylation domain-containing protein
LGGHSLLATQLMSRVREEFSVEVPLRQLFEQPTVRGLGLAVEEALRSGAGVIAPPIVPVSRAGNLPLSFAQQRLWFFDQLQPNSPIYNMPFPLRLTGQLNIEALEQTLSEIVRRHEVLRTTFASVAGQPVQIIRPPQPFQLTVTDLSGWDEAEREQQAQREVQEEARRAFDLTQGPLLRVFLVRLSAAEHVVLFTMHHIISDGWSLGVLVRELVTLYEAYLGNRSSPLPELAVQYADYAVWQRDWLQGEELEAQVQYWRAQLSGAPAVLELSTDKARPAVQSQRGAQYGFTLSAELTRGLRELSRSESASLFMTLLAGWQLLLGRYSGQDDVVVGTPIANRHRAEVEPLIGFFVNTLALRTHLDDELSFRDLLRQVKETALGAYAHQDLPFEKLVEELQPKRSLSHTPLFQVFFALQNAPIGELKLPGLELQPVGQGGRERALFDLSLSIGEMAEQLRCGLSYNTDLYEAATMQRLAAHYERLLWEAVKSPERQISELEMLSEEERGDLQGWSRSATEYEQRGLVPELFAVQATQHSESVAVSDGASSLTYGELNGRANQLAHLLIAGGVSAEVRVGVCLERSVEAVVVLLAIWKAGGVYLPLDRDHPAARLQFMLEDAQPQIVVVRGGLPLGVGAGEAQVLCLAEWQERIESQPEAAAEVKVRAEQLAYVIYTSGSTGEPKGVEVEHGQLRNTLQGAQEVYEFTRADVVPCLAPLTFDISLFEVLCPLLAGARLVLVEARQALEAATIEQLLDEITFWHSTPGLMRRMLEVASRRGDNGESRKWGQVRGLFVGGDVVLPELVGQMRESFPQAVVWVGYGPTEATIMCANYRVSAAEEVEHQLVGRAMGNVTLRLLDRHAREVAVGVVGEIYIGGAGVARGYLNRPSLTAERFLSLEGERYYRSGDLGRWLANGLIEFVGRADEQVKVRGYRIEVGEVESALTEHTGVREAVVTARGDGSGEKRLVAYVVGEEESPAPTVGELREHLRERLPEYMVPSVFVVLERLPLTANGKVDRRALPAPEEGGAVRGTEYVAPRTATEEVLARIWSELLGVERVGVAEDFFELGGHSLLATQLMSRVREEFSVEVPLRQLFEQPTVRGLGLAVEEALRSGAGVIAPPIVPVSRAGNLPLSFAQQRLWFFDQLQPNSPIYNIPFPVRLKGNLNTEALEQTLTEIVRRHEALRTSFFSVDGEPVQIINPARPVELSLIDLSELSERERDTETNCLAAAEARRPFDLKQSPLLRARLIKLGEDDHVVMLTLHHINSDAWSMNVMVNEIVVLYGAFRKGEPSPLPELTIQYADFAHWQRGWLREEVLDTELSYWRQQLEDAPAVLALPTDRPRPSMQTFNGAHLPIALSVTLAESLNALSRREGVTLFMTLLAAWQSLLARYSGQEDIVVGSPIANRNRAEVEPLIGFFVNTLVLRSKIVGEMSFRELLAQVREVCLGAYAHQDLPFEKLVEELKPERSLSHTPFFQVMFVLQNAADRNRSLELPGLEVKPVGVDNRSAMYDLTINLSEARGRIIGALTYNVDLFDEQTIRRLASHFEQLLEAMVANPDMSLHRLPMLTAAERKVIVSQWSKLEAVFPKSSCLHQLFEQQVERTPEATAVVFGEECLSYRELNERANRMAHYLRRQSVRSESLVGLLLERSVEMVVGVLGVLKAGGAYVPLDVQQPAGRLRYFMADAGVKLLVTQQRLLEKAPQTGAQEVCMDADWHVISQESGENPVNETTPENLAYVIYTSGSTGKPKGVMATHGAVCNLVEAQTRTFGIKADSRVLQFAAFGFDAAVSELFMALVAGATIYLAPQHALLPGPPLAALLRRHAIDTVTLPPSALSVMGDDGFPDLQTLIVAGEACPVKVVQQWAKGRRFFNAYGPTETTVCATIAEGLSDGRTPPIGRPLANAEVYLLDSELNVVPVGVTGELYIGGAGVTRGYLNRAELTAEHFIPHLYSCMPGARLYRSGDLARYLPDGQIDFLGRNDHQVKLRGYRIELGELEEMLAQHPSVRKAAVLLREDQPGNQRLVAYLLKAMDQVVAEGTPPAQATSDWRRFLQETLPEYMIPTAFVLLDEFPHTASGKVDRRALPAPERASGAGDGAFTAPRDLLEMKLARIWEEILDVDTVGVCDNFFELGGHSLLATRLMSRIGEVFGKHLPLTALFRSPTIEHLAGLLRQQAAMVEEFDTLIEIQPGKKGRIPLYCVHPSGGNVLGYSDLARYIGEGQPVYAFQSRGLDKSQTAHTTIKEMASFYVERLRSAQQQGPYLLGGWSMGGIVAFEMALQLQQQGQEVALLALMDVPAPTPAGVVNAVARPFKQAWAKIIGEDAFALTKSFCEDLGLPLDKVGLVRSKLEKLSPEDQLAFLLEQASQANLLPPGFEPEHIRLLFGIFKTNVLALQRYVAKRYRGRVVLFTPDDRLLHGTQNPVTSWARLIPQGFDFRVVPGNHYTMMRRPHIDELARSLREQIDQVLNEV